MEFVEFEAGGRFGLSVRQDCCSFDCDSLGQGASQQVMLFQTAEGRTYYKQAERAREQTSEVARDLKHTDALIASMFTPKGRVRRKVALRLAALADARRKQ